MLTDREIGSLITLLDEDDPEILLHVQKELLALGQVVLLPLLKVKQQSTNALLQDRINHILHLIQFNILQKNLKKWYESPEQDLLEGTCLVAQFQYPDVTPQYLLNQIDAFRTEIWLDMGYNLSPTEKVNRINWVLYKPNGFKGNTENYHHPDNSYLNRVLETKKGSPILLSVIYILVAQRLHLPVFGVNLPQHFVCVYKEENEPLDLNEPFNKTSTLNHKEGRPLFYINPFNQGAIFSKSNLEQFLKQLKMADNPDYYKACSSLDIVKRILRNLAVSFEQSKNEAHFEEIKQLLLICGEQFFPRPNQLNEDEDES